MNEYLDFNLEIDGAFGLETEQAVKSFQSKHRAEILSPWNINGPTGWWFKTTRAIANEILGCEAPAQHLFENGRVDTLHPFDVPNIFNSFTLPFFSTEDSD